MLNALERLAALLLIVLWAPILPIIILVIKLDSSGRVIFKQLRVGKDGKEFLIYKFRTMIAGSSVAPVTDREDPRITRVGKLLRRTRLDETPQLWNIVKGDMAFVGPRPQSIAGNKKLRKQFGKRYMNRYSMKPGIYGLTQLAWSRGESFRRMVACDELFRLRKSPFLSLKILILSYLRIGGNKTTF